MYGSQTTFNNGSSNTGYMYWTWRKTKNFFDIQTYTGNGSARAISHDLGCGVGMIWIKRLDSDQGWAVYHRGADGSAPEDKYLILNTTAAVADSANWWNDTAPTSSVFTVGTDHAVNADGGTYVAYIFAHNNSDGNFGLTGDQDVIKCGSYTGTGSRQVINLGFRPQYIIIKRTDATSDWTVFNDYSGLTAWDDAGPRFRYLNSATTEASSGTTQVYVSNDDENPGFAVDYTTSSINANNGNYIYMAISRESRGEPPSTGQVYGAAYGSDTSDQNPGVYAPDMVMFSRESGNTYDFLMPTRWQQNPVASSRQNAGSANFNRLGTFGNDGMGKIYGGIAGNNDWLMQSFKHWPGIFYTVHYTGTGSQRTIPHGLGAVPELMIFKSVSSSSDWVAYHKDMGTTGGNPKVMHLNFNYEAADQNSLASTTFVTDPTDSVFTVGTHDNINKNNDEYVGYMWASKDGFSSVGSYTGNGGSKTIDMGFSSGASFFVTKRVDAGGNWLHVNSLRTIVAGNDEVKYLNLSGFAAGTGNDWVDPTNSGIIVNEVGSDSMNTNNGTYIYWAMA